MLIKYPTSPCSEITVYRKPYVVLGIELGSATCRVRAFTSVLSLGH